MTQATRYGQLTYGDYIERALREGAMWTLIVVALYLLLALATYSANDPGWSHVGDFGQVSNAAGPIGAWFADVSFFLFGFFAYLIPVAVGWSAWLVFRGRGLDEMLPRTWVLAMRWLGFAITIAAGCGYAAIHLNTLGAQLPNRAGGGLGLFISEHMLAAFNSAGTDLLLAGALLAGITLFSGISWLKLVDNFGGAVLQAFGWLTQRARTLGPLLTRVLRSKTGEAEPESLPKALNLIDPATETAPTARPSKPTRIIRNAAAGSANARRRPRPRLDALPRQIEDAMTDPIDISSIEDLKRGLRPPPPNAPRIKKTPRATAKPVPAEASQDDAAPSAAASQSVQPSARTAITLPSLDLLDTPRPSGRAYSDEQIEELSRQVELKLADFGVQVRVVAVYPGPVVTLFELELAPGIKVSKITGLAKDLARALSTISVRVVEVIPGKSVIGIEIPNQQRETVFLRQIFDSAAYREAKSPLSLGLGTNISGLPVVVDLARMPHVLIAGTTGSGKSVAINVMILSLLYKAGPEDVRLIMVDPKMLELSVYEGIPHLLTPVVTDMKEAANALRWCVGEMERRYRLMAKLGVRNIAGYNRQIADAAAEGRTIPDPTITPEMAAARGIEIPALGHLPYIVVIIDELADMMMVVGKKVEELIARLAQKARASGIHLMLATQRPSVDVLTGLIKANIPTRIAFQVSSRIDSRTVLDQMGAEQLLGHGDMLYLPPGGSIPQRVHGAFVDDHEVHHIVEHLKQFGSPDYLEDVLREPTEMLPGIDPEPRGDTEDTDPLFDEAVQIVVESRRASISGVQRRLKIGYNRAARMIEEMERIGIVGPAETNGNREVLAPPPVDDD